MKDYQQKFLNLALEAKALEFGNFTLKSGRQSPYFFNAAKMLNGSNLYELASCYEEAIKDADIEFDCIYGPAYKGIFLGSMVAVLLSQNGNNYPLSNNYFNFNFFLKKYFCNKWLHQGQCTYY